MYSKKGGKSDLLKIESNLHTNNLGKHVSSASDRGENLSKSSNSLDSQILEFHMFRPLNSKVPTKNQPPTGEKSGSTNSANVPVFDVHDSVDGKEDTDVQSSLNKQTDANLYKDFLTVDSPIQEKVKKVVRRPKKVLQALGALEELKAKEALLSDHEGGDADDVQEVYEEPQPQTTPFLLKVQTRNCISVFTVEKTTSFCEITKMICAKEKFVAEGMVLVYNDMRLPPAATVASIGMTEQETLELHNSANFLSDRAEEFELKILSRHSRDAIVYNVDPKFTFSSVFQRFIVDSGLSSDVKFEFDGEVIDPNDTPMSLELESGDCIDAVD